MGRCAAAIPQGILFFGVVFVSGPKKWESLEAFSEQAMTGLPPTRSAPSPYHHCGEHQNPGGIVRELASARSLTEELVEASADVGIDLGGGSLGSWSHKRDRN